MLTPILFAALAVQSQIPASPPPTASALISKMLTRYAGAKSLGGSVRTTQVAGSATVVTETNIAYERPSKLHIDQRQRGSTISKDKMIVSNGVKFAYTPPESIVGAPPFLMEEVQPPNRDAQTIGDLYAIVASNLPDRSPVLDALVARQDDLRYFANQLAQFGLTGKETIGDKATNVIEGDWRESDAVGVSGKFKLYLTDGGDLIRYVLIQTVAAPSSIPGVKGVPTEQVTVTTTWDASITINAAINPETFVLKAP